MRILELVTQRHETMAWIGDDVASGTVSVALDSGGWSVRLVEATAAHGRHRDLVVPFGDRETAATFAAGEALAMLRGASGAIAHPMNAETIRCNAERLGHPAHVAARAAGLLGIPARALCCWCADRPEHLHKVAHRVTTHRPGECSACPYVGADVLFVEGAS